MKILTTIAVAALVLAGCAKKNDTTEAIQQGVVRDLATKFDMSKMDVIVDSVSFRDKEADATVTFTVKGGSAAQGMTMKYTMERHSDNQWYIKTRASLSGAQTGAPSPETAPETGPLPPGHPALTGADTTTVPPATGSNSTLPPGHPAIPQ